MRVIIDARGGDNAPKAPVLGALRAKRELGVDITLVGKHEEIERYLDGEKGVEIVDARDVITMEDDPSTATRRKKGSSMAVALTMLRLSLIHIWELGKLAESLGAGIVEKPTFGSEELVASLKALYEAGELESIELVGLCTDICVVSNALMLKAAMPELPMSVDSACCAGVTPQKHEAALEVMRSCQIAVK